MRKWKLLGLGALILLLLAALWHARPWDPIGPFGYLRVHLGMTDPEIAAILGAPSTDYRNSRHIGGITSPGMAAVLARESGLPHSQLPRRFGTKAQNGQVVTLRQWWGSHYAIGAAFDEQGKAVGVYLLRLERVNW